MRKRSLLSEQPLFIEHKGMSPLKVYRGNQNTHFMLRIFFSENRAVYEMMWKNNVEPGRPQLRIWSFRIACWKPTST